ncbi:MAG: hypothetical protein KC609_23950 [Myxococcales bacterium]|nr:hypothetical protein [Myxococcales bacterium]
MARPDGFELFCFYHLGLDRQWSYRFRNVNAAARTYGASVDEVKAWLASERIDPETVTAVPYALAKAHSEAQILALTASTAEIEAFAHRVYDDFRAAQRHMSPGAGLLSDDDFELDGGAGSDQMN